MNAEEFTEKFWIDTYVYGEYSSFIKHYWKENDIDIGMQPGDAELMKSAKIDFIAVNCYRSNVAKYAPHDAKQQDYLLNKNGVKGQMVFPVEPGRYALTRNPYVEYTDWDWEIDPSCLRYEMRYLWDHYHLPMMITENGYGAHETKDADGQVHDQGRIDYLREHIYQLGMAIEDGCEVIAYNPWSFTDLLSTGNGMAKRYGLVYIDTTDEEQNAAKSVEELSMKRIRKDSFYWYSKLIRSNGQDWGKEMLK